MQKGDFSGLIVIFENDTAPTIDGVNDGVNDGLVNLINDCISGGKIDVLSDDLKKEIIAVALLVTHNEGINANAIAKQLGNKSKPSIERYLRIIKKLEIIEYKGSAKKGGYFLTEKAKEILIK